MPAGAPAAPPHCPSGGPEHRLGLDGDAEGQRGHAHGGARVPPALLMLDPGRVGADQRVLDVSRTTLRLPSERLDVQVQ